MLIDVWTLGHFAIGTAFAFVTSKLWRVAFALVAWEWFENSETVPLPWGDPDFFNSVMDVFIGLTGFYLARIAFAIVDRKMPPPWRDWMKDAVDED